MQNHEEQELTLEYLVKLHLLIGIMHSEDLLYNVLLIFSWSGKQIFFAKQKWKTNSRLP